MIVFMNVSHFCKNLSGINDFTVNLICSGAANFGTRCRIFGYCCLSLLHFSTTVITVSCPKNFLRWYFWGNNWMGLVRCSTVCIASSVALKLWSIEGVLVLHSLLKVALCNVYPVSLQHPACLAVSYIQCFVASTPIFISTLLILVFVMADCVNTTTVCTVCWALGSAYCSGNYVNFQNCYYCLLHMHTLDWQFLQF